MGLWDVFLNLFRVNQRALPADVQRATDVDVIWGSELAKTEGHGLLKGMFPMGQPPRRGTRELMMAYSEMPWLRAVTHRIAQGVASVPMDLYQVRGVGPGAKARLCREYAEGDARERARMKRSLQRAGELGRIERSHPMHGLLRGSSPTQGNPLATGPMRVVLDDGNLLLNGRTCVQVSQLFQDLKGDGYAVKVRDENGVPVRWYPIPPHWVIQTPSVSRPFFRVSYQTWAIDLPEQDVWWWRDPDPFNPYGRGAGIAQALGDELQTDEFAAVHTKNWFAHGAIPQGLVRVKDANEDQLKALEKKWNNQHQGAFKSFLLHFTTSEVDVQQLSQTFEDMELVDLRRFLRDTVIQTFGVPPEVLGVLENSNRATITAAEYLFQKLVVLPRVEEWRERWQAIAPEFDERIVVDFESPVPADREFQLKVIQARPQAFTTNEVRELADMEPVDDPAADELPQVAPTPPPAPPAPPADEGTPKPAKKGLELVPR